MYATVQLFEGPQILLIRSFRNFRRTSAVASPTNRILRFARLRRSLTKVLLARSSRSIQSRYLLHLRYNAGGVRWSGSPRHTTSNMHLESLLTSSGELQRPHRQYAAANVELRKIASLLLDRVN